MTSTRGGNRESTGETGRTRSKKRLQQYQLTRAHAGENRENAGETGKARSRKGSNNN